VIKNYAYSFVAACMLSFLLSLIVLAFARYKKLYDQPTSERKRHLLPTPKIGGVAVVLSTLLVGAIVLDVNRSLIALFVAGSLVFIMGLLDDLKDISPYIKLGIQFLAAITVLAGGIGIVEVSNPLTQELIRLDAWKIPIKLMSFNFNIIPLANLVTVVWIVAIMNAINLSDGLDGLAVGVSSVSMMTLIFIGLAGFGSIQIIMLATILLGSLIGFLPFNLFPAKIFLGDAGAYFIGLMLAVLPIYANSKLAVASVVLSIVVIDMMFAFSLRLLSRKSPFFADRRHVHYRLLDNGLPHPGVVAILVMATLIVALTTIYYSSLTSVIVLILIGIILIGLVVSLGFIKKSKH
jgi:UDP-GlcNAc:undecaprenyl-phosphate GlcNAc-1-phosphate transferase